MAHVRQVIELKRSKTPLCEKEKDLQRLEELKRENPKIRAFYIEVSQSSRIPKYASPSKRISAGEWGVAILRRRLFKVMSSHNKLRGTVLLLEVK